MVHKIMPKIVAVGAASAIPVNDAFSLTLITYDIGKRIRNDCINPYTITNTDFECPLK